MSSGGPRNTAASSWGAHLGQQRIAHELQLVRRDVHRHVERGAQQLAALILELHEQPLYVARRRLVLRKQTRRLSVPLRFPPAWGPHAETPHVPPYARTPTATAAAILRPHVEGRRGGGTERRVRVAPGQPPATALSRVRRNQAAPEAGSASRSPGGLTPAPCTLFSLHNSGSCQL